ncbi:hypothetical protein PBY51_015441 [Eleginops maclovinus]|uniref:Uncharacterized protein n=1 Tax=Eleginops maclovinus TaxID=56733 RepID=A0AAN8A8V4_ELEMC|nr:hypothetical protein PBY51_015441 [Eleginops maclovinus]
MGPEPLERLHVSLIKTTSALDTLPRILEWDKYRESALIIKENQRGGKFTRSRWGAVSKRKTSRERDGVKNSELTTSGGDCSIGGSPGAQEMEWADCVDSCLIVSSAVLKLLIRAQRGD